MKSTKIVLLLLVLGAVVALLLGLIAGKSLSKQEDHQASTDDNSSMIAIYIALFSSASVNVAALVARRKKEAGQDNT